MDQPPIIILLSIYVILPIKIFDISLSLSEVLASESKKMFSETSAGKSQFMLKDIKRSPEENRIKSRTCYFTKKKIESDINNFI